MPSGVLPFVGLTAVIGFAAIDSLSPLMESSPVLKEFFRGCKFSLMNGTKAGCGWEFKTFCRSLWKVSASIVPLMSFSIKWRISRDRISDRAAKQSGPLRRWGICQSCLRQCDMYISQTSCTFPSLHRKKRLVLMTPSSSALLSPVSQWFAIFYSQSSSSSS